MQLALGARAYDLTTWPLVVGVLQVPGGAGGLDVCLERGELLVRAGADVVEVAAAPVTASAPLSGPEELDRLVPVVDALSGCVDVPLACATARASVARAAYAAGASMGNDGSGFSDPDYLAAAVDAGASVVAGHPGARDPDAVAAMRTFLAQQARRARQAGLPPERIVLDAGLDRCAAPQQSLQLLRASAALADLGHPLLTSSPRSVAGGSPGGAPDAGQGAAAGVWAVAVLGGSRLLRTGDVRTARRVADVLAAILAG